MRIDWDGENYRRFAMAVLTARHPVDPTMMTYIINRISLIGFIVWTVVLIGGLAVEILKHELIFEGYLSGSFGWMLILAFVYQVTRQKRTRKQDSGTACGEQPAAADPAGRGSAEP